MRRALLFLLPLFVLATAGAEGELNAFLSKMPSVGVSVVCSDGNYIVYPYSNASGVYALLVVQNGIPVFNYTAYRSVAAAYLQKEHLRSAAENMKILTPGTAALFSQLASKMKSKDYDYSLAAKYAQRCFPDYVATIQGLGKDASELAQVVQSLSQTIADAADKLTQYLKSSTVICGYQPPAGVYAKISATSQRLTKFLLQSKAVITQLAGSETNCSPDVVRAILDALKPPYTEEDLQYITTTLDSEEQMLQYEPSNEELRTLYSNTYKLYWRTLYEQALQSTVDTPYGPVSLKDAATILPGWGVRWVRADLIQKIQQDYSAAVAAANGGNYKKAYELLQVLRSDVEDLVSAGIAHERAGRSFPYWVVFLLVGGGVIGFLLLRRGGKGGSEADLDSSDGSDYYDYLYG